MEPFIGGRTELLIEAVNPFVEMKLISVSYGILSPENVAFICWQLIRNVKMKWKSSLMNKLVERKVCFYKPLNRLMLGTFTKMMKRLVKTKDGKILQFSPPSQIFEKIAIIKKTQKLDLKQLFCYPLGPVPWSLRTSTGELVKTRKLTLITNLKKTQLV